MTKVASDLYEKLFQGAVIGAVIFMFGAVVNHFWNRYRSRLRRFTWSAWYQKIAVTAQHPGIGKLEVLHNGKPFNNVYAGWIQIRNLSNSDFGNLVVKVSYQEGTEILGAYAALDGNIGELPLADDFVRVIESTDPVLSVKAKNNREYRVPAFNRGGTVNVYLVLARSDNSNPIANVATDTVGIMLRFEAQVNLWYGVPVKRAQAAGILLTLGITSLLLLKVHSSLALASGSWLSGALLLFIGAMSIRLYRWLLRQL